MKRLMKIEVRNSEKTKMLRLSNTKQNYRQTLERWIKALAKL